MKRTKMQSATATSGSSYWAPLITGFMPKVVKMGKKRDIKVSRLRARIRSVEYSIEILKAEKKRLAVELRGLIQKKLADEVVGEIAK